MNKNKKIIELVEDLTFVNWVNQSNENDIAKWESWITKHPGQADVVEEAQMMINGFPFKQNEITKEQTNQSWNSFSSKINNTNSTSSTKSFLPKQILKIAAIFLIGIFSIWGIQNWMNISDIETFVYETSTNETKLFNLPDGSKLTLNTNSKAELSFDESDKNNTILTLSGEGYFDIVKQPKGKKFLIQSKNLTIEVIGTIFNINGKRENPIVSLIEGKVNLIQKDFGTKKLNAGQTASFNLNKNQFEIVINQTEYWKSWTLEKWSFGDSTPVKEVLRRIEDTYGLDIQVDDPNIYSQNASGDIAIENKTILFEALSILLDIEMKEENGTLYVNSLKE